MTTLHTDMQAYFAQSAATHDQIHAAPERQADLAVLHQRLQSLFTGKRVLELACGTGYWTQSLAASATEVLATDINEEAIAIARTRQLPGGNVRFAVADAFEPTVPGAPPNACFAGLWWSHVARQRQAAFLDNLKSALAPQALLVLIDEVYVEGSSEPIARTDAEGNTYQIRRLPDGSRHEVLKQFPSSSALRRRLGGHLNDLRIERLARFWLLSGRFK